jgi:hypothetical protein
VKTYLVEAWSPEIEFDENSLIVALTPEVCYQLDKAGIEYSIIEDYYSEAELSALEDEYYRSQLGWIEGLDEFFQNNIEDLRKLNLKLATIYYYYLKTMVLDPLYIRCYTLNKLFKTVKPSNMAFISYSPKETPLDFRLQYDGKSYYSQVIPILCQENNIHLALIFLEPANRNLEALKFVEASVTARLRRALGNFEIVRKLYSIYKYFCQRPLLVKRPNEGKLRILVLNTGYGGADFVKDALRNGHKIYQLSENFILEHSSFRVRRHLNLKAKYESQVASLNNIWESTANLLEGDDLIKQINERCHANVSEIVLPRLKYFIAKVCPEILGYFKVFTEFYENERIDFVFTPTEVSPTEFAAIAAASQYSDIKSVRIFHGDDIFANKFWNFADLSHFDITIASNKELEKYFRRQCEANSIPTELYSSPHRLLNIKRIGHSRHKQKGGIRRRIIYLPTMLMGDARRLDGGTYPDTWYYEFQKSLIEYLSRKRDYIFVWKGLPTADAIYNPIPDFISDNNFSNIEIATNPFVEHLLRADRVICDYPSTGFYESVVVGVPTMCLYHRALIVRASAVDYFGNLLKPFSDAQEAIKHIDEFLNSDPESYQKTLEMGDESVLHILEKVGRKKVIL